MAIEDFLKENCSSRVRYYDRALIYDEGTWEVYRYHWRPVVIIRTIDLDEALKHLADTEGDNATNI